MKITIIGGGAIAKSIAVSAKAAGHDGVIGVRNLSLAKSSEFPPIRLEDAIVDADIVVIAVPYLATPEVLPPLADALAGKIVIDATNAVKADWSPYPTGELSSGTEQIQAMLPNSHIAKVFNTIYANVIRTDRLDRGGRKISLFVASDDAKTTRAVMAFGSNIGLATSCLHSSARTMPIATGANGIWNQHASFGAILRNSTS